MTVIEIFEILDNIITPPQIIIALLFYSDHIKKRRKDFLIKWPIFVRFSYENF